MTFYCTNCWKEINAKEKVCPECGMDILKLIDESFVQKLIRALNHPESETRIRAANILGKLKVKESLPILIEKIKSEKNPFILKALVEAILKIDHNKKSEIRVILGNVVPITLKKLF